MPMVAARRAAFFAIFAGAFFGLAGAAGADPRCVCRYGGDDYFLGECICMKTAAGERYACCDRVLNNTSWSFATGGCHVAEAKPPDSAAAAQLAAGASNAPAGRGMDPASPASPRWTRQRP